VPKEPGTGSDRSFVHPRASRSVGFPTAGLIYNNQSGVDFEHAGYRPTGQAVLDIVVGFEESRRLESHVSYPTTEDMQYPGCELRKMHLPRHA
jgi:hypothetical protein